MVIHRCPLAGARFPMMHVYCLVCRTAPWQSSTSGRLALGNRLGPGMKLAATAPTTDGSESLATDTSRISVPSQCRVGESVTRFRKATTMMTMPARRSAAGDGAPRSNGRTRPEDFEDWCLTSTAPLRKAILSLHARHLPFLRCRRVRHDDGRGGRRGARPALHEEGRSPGQ